MQKLSLLNGLLFTLLLVSGCTSPSGPSLLSPLPASETGIDCANQLSESEELNIITFEYFYNGAGVGAGDLDRDGLPDLCFTSNMGNARLYRNLGSLKFEDITKQSGINTKGRWTTGVALADIKRLIAQAMPFFQQ